VSEEVVIPVTVTMGATGFPGWKHAHFETVIPVDKAFPSADVLLK
jgi:hypothetical protein